MIQLLVKFNVLIDEQVDKITPVSTSAVVRLNVGDVYYSVTLLQMQLHAKFLFGVIETRSCTATTSEIVKLS